MNTIFGQIQQAVTCETCKGTGKVGDACNGNNNCAPGETCLKVNSSSSQPQCELLCPNSPTTCSATQSCVASDGIFGYCS